MLSAPLSSFRNSDDNAYFVSRIRVKVPGTNPFKDKNEELCCLNMFDFVVNGFIILFLNKLVGCVLKFSFSR